MFPFPRARCTPDLNPLWMVAGAEFTLAGEGTGQRTVAAKDFFLGYRRTALQPHEILLKASRQLPCIACGQVDR